VVAGQLGIAQWQSRACMKGSSALLEKGSVLMQRCHMIWAQVPVLHNGIEEVARSIRVSSTKKSRTFSPCARATSQEGQLQGRNVTADSVRDHGT
jgi:hypothetical protein